MFPSLKASKEIKFTICFSDVLEFVYRTAFTDGVDNLPPDGGTQGRSVHE